jgi:cytochrome b561
MRCRVYEPEYWAGVPPDRSIALSDSRRIVRFARKRYPTRLHRPADPASATNPQRAAPAIMAARYTTTAIALHWSIALLLLCSAGLGLYMVGLTLSPAKLKLYSWHKWVGVTIFMLAVLRVAWRLTHPAPPLSDATPPWQRKAAAVSHFLLYLLLLSIPVSGWLMSSALGVQTVYLGLLPLPDLLARDKALGEQLKLVHLTLNCTLAALVAVHAAAALKHHFVDRDDVLHRMLPLVRPRTR